MPRSGNIIRKNLFIDKKQNKKAYYLTFTENEKINHNNIHSFRCNTESFIRMRRAG